MNPTMSIETSTITARRSAADGATAGAGGDWTLRASTPASLSVGSRFAGPPGVGNGGYSCGRFARLVDGPAEVTLRRPVPLERGLEVRPGEKGTIEVTDRGALVAEVRAIGPLSEIEPPLRPSVAEALECSTRSAFLGPMHPFPSCFVCGPEHADGLRLHPGPIGEDPGVQVALLRPPSVVAEYGAVAPEIVWAALDCPSLPATRMRAGIPHLLARLSAERLAPVPAHEPSVVVGWQLGVEGRKLHSACAVLSPEGEILARARALWVVPRSEQTSQLFPPTHQVTINPTNNTRS